MSSSMTHNFSMQDAEETAGQPEPNLAAKMLEARTIVISGQVDEKLAERVMSQTVILNSLSHDPIRVIVTSQGGHVDSGYAIHDLFRFVESPIVTIGAGWVASIGVPILLSAEKDSRFCLPNTRFLLHQPSGGAGGQATDIRIAAEEILKLRERLNGMLAEETGQTVEKVQSDSDRNFWMTAEEAQEYGLVSRIIEHASEIS